ncbi:MAG TPA: hypothetical protein VGS58_03170 [Candidatus Sulfopaludibacter sp.]|nr:hypothetical protein [Candidatus Sulfopaludibacter sp.]
MQFGLEERPEVAFMADQPLAQPFVERLARSTPGVLTACVLCFSHLRA